MPSSEPQQPANALLQPAQSLYEIHIMGANGTYTTNSSWVSDVAISPNSYQQYFGDIAFPPQVHHLVPSSIPNSTTLVPLHGPSFEVLPGPRPLPPTSRQYYQSLHSVSSHTYPPHHLHTAQANDIFAIGDTVPQLGIYLGFTPWSYIDAEGQRAAVIESGETGEQTRHIWRVIVKVEAQLYENTCFPLIPYLALRASKFPIWCCVKA